MFNTQREPSSSMPPAMHRAIVCVDVEAFGDLRRTNLDQAIVRSGLYRILNRAFDHSNIPWTNCYHEDRGDGAFILVPPEVPKIQLVSNLPQALLAELTEHNKGSRQESRIRLRLAIHAGEVHRDEHGIVGTALNFAFRLLAADALREALSNSPGTVALIASQWFFEEVIRHSPENHPDHYRPIRVVAKETDTTAWIRVPEDSDSGQVAHTYEHALWVPSMMSTTPRQLPTTSAQFVGRATELAILTQLLIETSTKGACPAIAVIEGTAGIGKTALAVHWAYQQVERFPDGQLYVNLRGFDPSGAPMTPAEAIRGFLDALEVPDERIPVSISKQAAMFRNIVANRRMLLLLDNARSTDQIRPLLPNFPGCVLVTSRNRLTGLIAAEGAYPLPLGLLTTAEARQLLTERIGTARVSTEPEPVKEIISSCARLPLTLSIAAARAATNPTFPLTTLSAELRDARNGLDVFEGGEVATDARAVFSWSYEQLNKDTACLFRQLALHPGPDITMPAAASLAGIPLAQARRTLNVLTGCHLIDESAPGRFAFHDLLRVYASELAYAVDSEHERNAAIYRLLDHYLFTASKANLHLYPDTEPVLMPPASHRVVVQEFSDHTAAWAWFETELPALLSTIHVASTTDYGPHAWQLPWMLVEFFQRSVRWQDWATTHRIGLAAAEHRGDRYGQARSHQGIGRVAWRLGHYEEARVHLRRSLEMFLELNSQTGEIVGTYLALSTTFERLGMNREALEHAQKALALSRTAGHLLWQARALNRVGWYHALLGYPDKALTECRQSLAEVHKLGDRNGEARTLHSVGYIYYLLDSHAQASAYFSKSLALRSELGDRHGEANVLTHIGDAHLAAGDTSAANTAWRSAVKILTEIGHPDAEQVHARMTNRSDKNR